MDERKLKEISEVFQSSKVNFLFGAGASMPFLPLLGNIEDELNKASGDAKIPHFKRYIEEVMIPNKGIIDGSVSTDDNYKGTLSAYQEFFKSLANLVLDRKSRILGKQVNIFTTNIDLLMEISLDSLQLEYNDGFSSKISPIFNLANFKRSLFQRSLHFEHQSEIPVFNLIKLHGSLTWVADEGQDRILFSSSLDHFDNSILSKDGDSFQEDYKKILVVNPQESKHLESVLNVYYSELLRMYSSELEKENSLLFMLGFSMNDQHIREITLRSAKSNPTLRIFVCCSEARKGEMQTKLDIDVNSNVEIITPTTDKFTLSKFTEEILNKINNNDHGND